jgi:transposase
MREKLLNWEEIDSLLGNYTDKEIALKYNVSHTVIYRRRKTLNINSTVNNINWEIIDPLLGTLPDRKLASQTGVSSSSISNRRKDLNISPYNEPSKKIIFHDSDIENIKKMLGKASDNAIAQKYDVNVNVIRRLRIRLNIPPHIGGSIIDWNKIDPLLKIMAIDDIAKTFNVGIATLHRRRNKLNIPLFKPEVLKRCDWSEIDPLLGKMTDEELSNITKISFQAISKRRKKYDIKAYKKIIIDWTKIDALLGTAPDKDLAERFDVSQQSISRRRNHLGIPRFFNQYDGWKRGTKIKWDIIEPYLGTMTDKEVANKFGINKSTVRGRRHTLNIPAFKKPFNWEMVIDDVNSSSDIDSSKKYRVSIGTIRRLRKKYGKISNLNSHEK